MPVVCFSLNHILVLLVDNIFHKFCYFYISWCFGAFVRRQLRDIKLQFDVKWA